MAFKSRESGGQLATGNAFVQRASGSTTQPTAAGTPGGHGSQQGARKHFPSKSKGGLKSKIMGQQFGKYGPNQQNTPYTPGDIINKKKEY